MILFEIIVALLLIGAVLALWADRIGVPYPALLALAGRGCRADPGRSAGGARPGARARPLRRPRAARCGVRRVSARPARQPHARHAARGRRRGADDRGRRLRRAADRAGHELVRRDRARRHRRAAGRFGRNGGAPQAAAAASGRRDPRRRKPRSTMRPRSSSIASLSARWSQALSRAGPCCRCCCSRAAAA